MTAVDIAMGAANIPATTMAPLRLLHTMLRVRDPDRAQAFYVGLLGMRLLRRADYPSGRFSNLFVGYDCEQSGTVLELTWNWDHTGPYEPGTAFGHLAIGTPDLYGLCEHLRSAGVRVIREPGPLADSPREIAFVLDPDGYKLELIKVTP